jgi:hypothetical protein
MLRKSTTSPVSLNLKGLNFYMSYPSNRHLYKKFLLIILFATMLLRANSQNLDFSQIQNLLGGGYTINPDIPFSPDAECYTELFPVVPDRLGTARVRLMNIDRNILKTDEKGAILRKADGSLDTRWGDRLENCLWMCKQYSWVPRIVWGVNGQDPLVTLQGSPQNHLYGPNNWQVFDEMTVAMLKHVVEDWGFKKIEIEVGNEPSGYGHAEGNWWMADISDPPYSEDLMWRQSLDPYCKLYRHVARMVKAYRDQQTFAEIKVGGPAGNYGTFLPTSYPWLQTFVARMLNNDVPLDFVSFHCYHKTSNQGLVFIDAIANLKKQLSDAGSNAEICVSEWGFGSAQDYDTTNFEPVAGGFALDFMYTSEKAGLKSDLFLSIANNGDPTAPSLFYPHIPTGKNQNVWSVSYAGIALQQLADLSKGQRYKCDVDTSYYRCFASEISPGVFNILVWAFNWETAEKHALWKPDPIAGSSNASIKIYGLSNPQKVTPILKSLYINGDSISSPSLILKSVSDSIIKITNLALKKGDFANIIVKLPESSKIASASTDNLVSQKDGVKLYPNPARDILNIQGLSSNSSKLISVTDKNGELVIRKIMSGTSFSINTTKLRSGVYYLKIDDGRNNATTYKFFKEE